MSLLRATGVALLACVPAVDALAAIGDKPFAPRVRVEVTREGAEFIAEYTFDRPVEAWVMPRSDVTRDDPELWRPRSWTVETRGVRLQHVGHYDVLTAARGEMPLQVRVRVRPFGRGLRADYTPALLFTDGAVALFVAQFEMFPMDSLREVRALPSDLNNQLLPAAEITYVFRDPAGAVLLEGKRERLAETRKSDTYAFFGETRPLSTPHLSGILDLQLPAWIRESLSLFVPALMSRYTQELGALPAMKPTLFVSWAGATPRLVSRGGSVLRGMIVMTYEGAGMLDETTEQRHQGLWFIAHEAAHLYQGSTSTESGDAWITEGGAEAFAAMAMRADASAYVQSAEENALGKCREFLKGRSVRDAIAAGTFDYGSVVSTAAYLEAVSDVGNAGIAEWVQKAVAEQGANLILNRTN